MALGHCGGSMVAADVSEQEDVALRFFCPEPKNRSKFLLLNPQIDVSSVPENEDGRPENRE